MEIAFNNSAHFALPLLTLSTKNYHISKAIMKNEISLVKKETAHWFDIRKLEGLRTFSKTRHTFLADDYGGCKSFKATTDICDSNSELLKNGDIRILPPIFKIYGKNRAFSSMIFTFKVFEHNVSLYHLVQSNGEGRVLVIDGGGNMRSAVIGGGLIEMAKNNGWVGIIVYGCIRDIDEINGCDIGVRALASCPRKPGKVGITEKHVSLNIEGTMVHDGEWLYADSDGIIISKTELFIDPAKLNIFF